VAQRRAARKRLPLFIIGLPVVHRDRKAHGNRPSRALRLVAHSPASLDDED
jgi:hypothetical protein